MLFKIPFLIRILYHQNKCPLVQQAKTNKQQTWLSQLWERPLLANSRMQRGQRKSSDIDTRPSAGGKRLRYLKYFELFETQTVECNENLKILILGHLYEENARNISSHRLLGGGAMIDWNKLSHLQNPSRLNFGWKAAQFPDYSQCKTFPHKIVFINNKWWNCCCVKSYLIEAITFADFF